MTTIVLELTEDEAVTVHHSLATTVELMDQVGDRNIPDHAPLKGRRADLVIVAKRLDHERRHKGAVPNPNGPGGESAS